jgi:hypothetical protein
VTAPSHQASRTPAEALDGPGRALVASIAENAGRQADPGERYGSAQALVLDQGRAWTPTPLPDELEEHRGVPGHCYEFAARLVDDVPELVYVEGYACPFPGSTWAIPHAWVGRLADGAALDPTWPVPGPAYYGIPLTAAYRRDAPRGFDTHALLVEMCPRSVRAGGLPPGAVATGTS